MSRREDQAHVEVTVKWRGQTRDLGVFDTWSGGDTTSDNTKHRRGSMGKQRALGGSPTVSDITVSRDFDLARDSVNKHWLRALCGNGEFIAKKFELDDNEDPFGRPEVFRGKVIEYHGPDADSNSSDTAMLELVLSPDSDVA